MECNIFFFNDLRTGGQHVWNKDLIQNTLHCLLAFFETGLLLLAQFDLGFQPLGQEIGAP